MNKCPYCERELVTDKSHKDVYYCRKFGHHFITEPRGYSDFSINNDKDEWICFYSKAYESLLNIDYHITINDFGILKGKSFEELQVLYNKLKVFK